MTTTTSAIAPSGLKRLAGFFAGLGIIISLDMLWIVIRLATREDDVLQAIVLSLFFAVRIVLFILLERKFWLSRLMGVRHLPHPIAEGVVYAVLGFVWAFLQAMGSDSKTASEENPDTPKVPHPPRDAVREAIETIVFVVVLVLLLKLFVTEAFVIPTGSMAETLYGYQKMVTCPKCGHEFPVNSHDEVEPNQLTGRKHQVVGFTCPNCRYHGKMEELSVQPPNRTGDRVLVLKPIYHLSNPQRGDVVVFKYPEEPQQKHTAQNYIKRAMGFGNETVGIHRGELFVTRSLEYPADLKDENGELLFPRPEDPKDLWRPRYMYADNRRAADLFEKSRAAGFPAGGGGFEIVRKNEQHVLACLRIVWDNDQQPKELAGSVPPRWYAPPEYQTKWTGDNPQQPRAFAHTAAELDWVRYRHIAGGWDRFEPESLKPRPIDNFLGYNAGSDYDPFTKMVSSRAGTYDSSWVGDLSIQCEAELSDGAEVVLELSKGVNRFQATFAGGTVKLTSTGPGGKEFGSRPTAGGKPGRHTLHFANIDCRLWVWVDGHRVDFGTDADYNPNEPPAGDGIDPEGWTQKNDVDAPASIGAKGRVTVRNIKLHRDIYYTRSGNDPTKADLFYVHPGHYLCLGDNSAQSSDSRRWGTVPDRLLLGKAVFVFFPISRVGFIK